MWNLHDDNELDNLSREAAEGYSMDRSSDSWNKLQVRLDAEMPEQRRRRYLLFFLLFLFVGSGLFWLSRINTADADDEVLTDNSSEQVSPKSTAPNALGAKPSAKKDASLSTSPETNRNAETKDAQRTTPDLSGNSNSDVDATNTPRTLDNKSRENISVKRSKQGVGITSAINGSISSRNKKNHPVGESKSQPAVEKSKKPVDEQTANVVAEEDNISKGDKPASSPVAEETKTDQPAEQKVDKQESQVSEQKTTDPIEKNPSQKSNSRWIFSAAYAPDISTVNFTHTQSPGLNIGVFVDYKLSNRWLLQGGIIYTKKNYKMKGEDFHPPKGGWFDHVKLEDVTGSCYMIDFPLNARYNAIHKKSFNVFAGAGLSSYLMKKEEYSYYGYYYGNPINSNREYEGSEGYILSILNVSIGYEKKLSNSFSMQVEPFFKQTLKGVGFGDISLSSTGVYFSLRYNPVKIQHTNKTASK